MIRRKPPSKRLHHLARLRSSPVGLGDPMGRGGLRTAMSGAPLQASKRCKSLANPAPVFEGAAVTNTMSGVGFTNRSSIRELGLHQTSNVGDGLAPSDSGISILKR